MDLLKRLSECNAPSGNEAPVRALIASEIEVYVDELKTDALGNLIAHKKGVGKRILFAAHMDEIGIMVTFIDEKGFLRFAPVGGVDAFACLYRKVTFMNGVVGVVSYEESLEEMKDLKINKLFIDIGARSREEAEGLVSIGDVAAFSGVYTEQGDMISGKALDNRAGCYLLIETIKAIRETHHDLYFVFTAQEEVGLRGAKTSAYGIEPDMAFAVDVTDTGDTPNAKPMAVELGKGPAVKIKDHSVITHPLARNIMFDAARKMSLPYQLEVLECGGTDAGAIHLTGFGVPTGALSVPTRYIHTPAETVSKQDLERSVTLLTELAHYDYDGIIGGEEA